METDVAAFARQLKQDGIEAARAEALMLHFGPHEKALIARALAT